MRKSTVRSLLCSLCTAVFVVSCATHQAVKDYTPIVAEKATVRNPYFADDQTDYVYKANINAYGHELTGIFIAKKINATTHRVVFTTEFGNKLLDFEISPTDFKVNSIVEELNRKMLINTLKTDFRLLLQTDFKVDGQFAKTTSRVYQNNDGNHFNYLYLASADNKLYQITRTTKTKEQITIRFTSENNIFAETITVQHTNIKLQMVLSYFKEK